MIFAATLSACVETGDFGRRKSSGLTGWTGFDHPPDQTLSTRTLTDDETELRSRAFYYLAAPRAPLYPTPELVDRIYADDVETYYARLAGHEDRSPSARYQRLASDIEADRDNLEPFRIIACRVKRADRIRQAHLKETELPDHERDDVITRMDANAGMIADVEARLLTRASMYERSFMRLRLQSPEPLYPGRLEAMVRLSLQSLRDAIGRQKPCIGK